MKISDPIIFGHCVTVYFKDVFAKYAATFAQLGVIANNGLGDVYDKDASLPEAERKVIEADVMNTYKTRPPMAMVNSDLQSSVSRSGRSDVPRGASGQPPEDLPAPWEDR